MLKKDLSPFLKKSELGSQKTILNKTLKGRVFDKMLRRNFKKKMTQVSSYNNYLGSWMPFRRVFNKTQRA